MEATEEAVEEAAGVEVGAREDGSESPLQVPNTDWQPVLQ